MPCYFFCFCINFYICAGLGYGLAFFFCYTPCMIITKKLLTVNQFSRPGTLLSGVKGVVIHWVGNAGKSAAFNVGYFESLKNQVYKNEPRTYAGAHFVIGLDGTIIQCIPTSEVAYHVGSTHYTARALSELSSYPNNCTLGIELTHPDWTGKFTTETYESALVLSAQLLRQFSLTAEKGLWRHFDITGKNCPRHFVKSAESWKQFKDDVNDLIKE